MFKKITIPSSFSLIRKGRIHLLLHNDYKESLLHQGIEDIESFLNKNLLTTQYLNGRTPHPSIPIQDDKRVVIRKYSHGGVLRFLNPDLFSFGRRSFQELSLTEEIRSAGIPTIQPIGAIHQTVVPFLYRAYLLSLKISNAMDLVRYLKEIYAPFSTESLFRKRKMIKAAGALLRQFHQSGFYHRDLQLKNLLVAGDQILIIDFDRSCRKATISIPQRMRNLLRLNRSVDKWKRSGLPITKTDRWRFFLAYAGNNHEIHQAIRIALGTYSMGLLFHRIGWALKN